MISSRRRGQARRGAPAYHDRPLHVTLAVCAASATWGPRATSTPSYRRYTSLPSLEVRSLLKHKARLMILLAMREHL